jgi:hypothetical protein
MSTNGRLEGRNGHAIKESIISNVSLKVPQEARHGIVAYGQVLSSDGKTSYIVKKKRTGKYRFTYYCSCPGSFLGGHRLCRHIAIFKLAENGQANMKPLVLRWTKRKIVERKSKKSRRYN